MPLLTARKLTLLALLFTSVLMFNACSAGDTIRVGGKAVPVEGSKIKPTDYADAVNWLALPKKTTKYADIFYLYPTTWVAAEGQFPIADINHPVMREGAQKMLEDQASAFETAGDIYAPYYRQLDAIFILGKDKAVQDRYLGGVPAADVIAAFDYYIKNYNNGRPFVLVGHSQGAAMVKELLYKYLKDNPAVYKKMIAAYAIGFSITQDELDANPHIKFAQGAFDTGVVISYNTEAPVVEGKNYTVADGAISINPITWTRSEMLADVTKNLGSREEIDGIYRRLMNLADAKVNLERGTVVCSSVDPQDYYMSGPLEKYFPLGIYHVQDIPFYYYNLRDNVENRVKQFVAANM